MLCSELNYKRTLNFKYICKIYNSIFNLILRDIFYRISKSENESVPKENGVRAR